MGVRCEGIVPFGIRHRNFISTAYFDKINQIKVVMVGWIGSYRSYRSKPYFKEIEFLPGGECVSVYGDETIRGKDKQEWTKGYVLRKWNSTACAYEIVNMGSVDYLFMEWKSGDYRWGGFDTDYYVFVRS